MVDDQRIPKAGEVWNAKLNTHKATIKFVDDAVVFGRLENGEHCSWPLIMFVTHFTQPKPQPREIWVNEYVNGKLDGNIHSTRSDAMAWLPASRAPILFREVIEADAQRLEKDKAHV